MTVGNISIYDPTTLNKPISKFRLIDILSLLQNIFTELGLKKPKNNMDTLLKKISENIHNA